MFGIEEGRICISRFDATGTETVVAIVEEGELFELPGTGESPPPLAMAEALEACRLRPIDPHRIDQALEDDPSLQRKLAVADLRALRARGAWR